MTELDRVIGHSLTEALIRGEAQGLPPIPQRWRAAVAEVAGCCHENRFVYLVTTEPKFLDVNPSWRPGVWILDHIAPDVAAHYVLHPRRCRQSLHARVRGSPARRFESDLRRRRVTEP